MKLYFTDTLKCVPSSEINCKEMSGTEGVLTTPHCTSIGSENYLVELCILKIQLHTVDTKDEVACLLV